MNDLIEKIGPFLGIAAFLGLAVLAFLIFQQARDVRRLREWAGRAPERAGDAAEAAGAAAEARGEVVEEEEAREEPAEPGRLARWWQGVRDRISGVYDALDRRMPVDPRYLLAVLAAGIVAAGVLTSGFGLVGGDGGTGGDGKKGAGKEDKPEKIEVAVLNATQVEAADGTEIQGVQGLAAKVADEVVKPAGYKAGKETDATSGLPETVIMFETGEDASANETEAEALAKQVADQLGETSVTAMTEEVRALSGGAPLALVIGADDAEF